MIHEMSPYSNPEVAIEFDEMVTQDTAKQVIYADIIDQFTQLQTLSPDTLTFADMGCGTGQFIGQLSVALPNSNVIYADGSKANLAITSRKMANYSVAGHTMGVCMDLEKGIALDSTSVDAMSFNFVASEIPHLGRLLKECRRVLSPRGLCVFSMTSPLSDKLTTILRQGKIEGVDFFGKPKMSEVRSKVTDADAVFTYTLGQQLKIPHYYREMVNLITTFHKEGFHLTEDDIVRFYPTPASNGLPIPLPEYLIFYGRKDERRYFGGLKRKSDYRRTKGSEKITEKVHSVNPKKEFYRVGNNTFSK